MPLTSPVYARAVSTHVIGQAIPRYDRCMMSAAILFSGFLASKVLRFLDMFGTEHIARSTHFGHQKMFLRATVHSEWKNEQNENLQVLRRRGGHLVLETDGGWNSPGHSAK